MDRLLDKHVLQCKNYAKTFFFWGGGGMKNSDCKPLEVCPLGTVHMIFWGGGGGGGLGFFRKKFPCSDLG